MSYRKSHHVTEFGFTLVEMLVVVAVVATVAALGFSAFYSTNVAQALEKDTARVVASIERARSLTLSSSAHRQYGVHVEANKVTIFPGASYSSGNVENQLELLTTPVNISSYALSGGGSDIVFDRLTGKTNNAGTITVSLISSSTVLHIITVRSTGLVEVD